MELVGRGGGRGPESRQDKGWRVLEGRKGGPRHSHKVGSRPWRAEKVRTRQCRRRGGFCGTFDWSGPSGRQQGQSPDPG